MAVICVVGNPVKPVLRILPFVFSKRTTGKPFKIFVLYTGVSVLVGWLTSLLFPDASVQELISSPSNSDVMSSDFNHSILELLFPTPPGPVWAIKKLLLKKDMDQLVDDAYLEVAAQKLGYKSVLELKKKLNIKPWL